MNLYNGIGGYFELEIRDGQEFIHDGSILLNSARNCFEYILRANKIKHVYMPKYTCDVMFEPLAKLNVAFTLYSINEDLETIDDIKLEPEDYIVYTNYFGLKDGYSRSLSQKYGAQLILDCSQSLFFEPLSTGHTFYSPRKFIGLPDGGCLYTDTQLDTDLEYDSSYQRMAHLIKRIDLGAEAAYSDFKQNDQSLIGQPIKKMSRLTRRLMGAVEYDDVVKFRRRNFQYLQQHLESTTRLAQVNLDTIACPMYFPYKTNDVNLRKKLIDNKIFIPTYWPNVLEDYTEEDVEYRLAEQLLLLPIDQRYNQEDMERIIGTINAY